MEARKAMQRASGLAGFQNSLSKRPTPICKECAKKLSVGPLKSWKLYGGQICCGELQPRTKPVETNRENACFFLSSWQKLKPPPNECPISPLPLSKVV